MLAIIFSTFAVTSEVHYVFAHVLQLWSGRQLNYTAKNAFRVNGTSCRGTNCHVRYGPVPGLLSNETYCVLISRAPNATYNGSRTGEPQVLTVQYRARTDCGAAGAMRIMVSDAHAIGDMLGILQRLCSWLVWSALIRGWLHAQLHCMYVSLHTCAVSCLACALAMNSLADDVGELCPQPTPGPFTHAGMAATGVCCACLGCGTMTQPRA